MHNLSGERGCSVKKTLKFPRKETWNLVLGSVLIPIIRVILLPFKVILINFNVTE